MPLQKYISEQQKNRNWLYHVTNIQYLDSEYIDTEEKIIYPFIGDISKSTEGYQFWEELMDEGELTPEQEEIEGTLFFSEEPMLHYMHRSLGSGSITFDETYVRENGLIIIVEKNEYIYQLKDGGNNVVTDYTGMEVDIVDTEHGYIHKDQLPYWIETGDWFSLATQEYEYMLYGDKMIEFLNKNYPNKIK